MTSIRWDEDAKKRLKKIPFFARSMAKKKIESEALKRGETIITAELMQEIKQQQHS